MALTFNSKSIKKVVDIDGVQHLSNPELRLLRDELTRAIITMEESLGNIAYEKHVAGEVYNEDWHLRVKRKQQICGAFLEKIEIVFDEKENTNPSAFDEARFRYKSGICENHVVATYFCNNGVSFTSQKWLYYLS